MASVEQLIEKIQEANTNISGRLGRLDQHITNIIRSAQELLMKIRSGKLTPDQTSLIRERLEQLRTTTLRNINAKNSRITEIDKIFTEILKYLSPNGTIAQMNGAPANTILPEIAEIPESPTIAESPKNAESPTIAESPQSNLVNSIRKDDVKDTLLAIPDDTTRVGKYQTDAIIKGIETLVNYLKQTESPINNGLLKYLNDIYAEKEPQSLVGAIKAKHKPVLLYILSLANTTPDEFLELIQRPITNPLGEPIYPRSDLQTRVAILNVVKNIPEFPDNEQSQAVYSSLNTQLGQQGGKRNRKTRMGCGCGVKLGGRRNRKTRKQKTRKQKSRVR